MLGRTAAVGLALVGLALAGGADVALAHPPASTASSTGATLTQGPLSELDGDFEIVHEDLPTGGRYSYFLHSQGVRYSLLFSGRAPDHLLTGAKLRVRGVRVGNTVALEGHTPAVQQLAQASAPNTLGEQRTLVILVNFQDNPIEPYTIADAQNVFDTTSEFFLENSSQQTWLVGDVVGWFTIALTSPVCDILTLATQAQAAASAAGVDLAAYTRYVYAFPENACDFLGAGTLGGSPSKAWIRDRLAVHEMVHEIGHNLGLYHSHSLNCGTTTLGTNCTVIEYGDIMDTMGGPIGFAYAQHFNAFQKERLGWLNAGVSPPITTVTTSGTYTLDAFESPSIGPKALKVFKSKDATTGAKTWYYVEARQPTGFDAFLATDWYVSFYSNVQNGVLLRLGTDANGNSSHLLNLTPDTQTWWDPALVAGQSFQDAETGVTITTDWVNATQAAVTVRFGTAGTTPTGPAAVTVSTDAPTYTRNQIATITTKVTAGGVPVANAAVSFRVTKADATVVTGTATTRADGTAVYKLRVKRQDPVGTYEAGVVATKSSMSGTGSAVFTVK